MNNLAPALSLIDGIPRASSLQTAEHFGKPHADVLKVIRRVCGDCPNDFNEGNFSFVDYVDEKGESRPMCMMTRDGFALIVMGFTGKKALAWKLRYIEAFNAMEAELRGQSQEPTTTLTPSQCRELHNVMDAKLSQFPASVQGKARSEAWTRFNRKFRIARYEQLPAHLFAEGMDYLIGMQIKAVAAPAAPRPLPSATPAIDEYKRHVDNVLVALTLFRSNMVMDAQLEAGAKRLGRRDLWPIQQALFDAIGANAAAIESSKRLMDVAQQVLMQQM